MRLRAVESTDQEAYPYVSGFVLFFTVFDMRIEKIVQKLLASTPKVVLNVSLHVYYKGEQNLGILA